MLVAEELICYHCGQACVDNKIAEGDKVFCCDGCRVVYDLLDSNNLCEYYEVDEHPGQRPLVADTQGFEYLNETEISRKVLEFETADFSRIKFFIPAIHCSSCIWLLENLSMVTPAILKSEVNFSRKTVSIDFNPKKIELGSVAGLLSSLGYKPSITTDSGTSQQTKQPTIVFKLAVAGFCFGNVMLFSFPEYLGLDPNDVLLRNVFSWLNLGLSIPVLVYSAGDYFSSAIKSFRQRQINIDVPIAVGLMALFFRSAWDIVTHFGPGYLDSFTGLVFFLLIGRWFQARTYETLAFDRDYKSYFPLAVQRLSDEKWVPTIIFDLQIGDRIKIRNLEIVPADSVLEVSEALIDYSFVTGEARPVKVSEGEKIFAGGRVLGSPVALTVAKETSQSHLTSLWNNKIFQNKKEGSSRKIIDLAASKFTWIVISIAMATGVYWYVVEPSAMWLTLTSVLMVACPCALALAAPFTYGSMLRAFGNRQFYLKNAEVVERLSRIDAIVFDKTGTITTGDQPEVSFVGNISGDTLADIKLLAGFSAHPLSNIISRSIDVESNEQVVSFDERKGKGIQGTIRGRQYKLGSAQFVGFRGMATANVTRVFVSINNEIVGYFQIRTAIRENINDMLDNLGKKCVALLSGDNDGDRPAMSRLFPPHVKLLFNQQPQNKLAFIKRLQEQGKKVLMVGDGLNDGGALMQADVGIAITDDTALFTPACDGILQGGQLRLLDRFMSLSKTSTVILKSAFIISFCYNAIALAFAVTGHLTPLIAAVLMPISSISVVSFSTFTTNYFSSKKISISK
jgi:P-type Cu+ transporter